MPLDRHPIRMPRLLEVRARPGRCRSRQHRRNARRPSAGDWIPVLRLRSLGLPRACVGVIANPTLGVISSGITRDSVEGSPFAGTVSSRPRKMPRTPDVRNQGILMLRHAPMLRHDRSAQRCPLHRSARGDDGCPISFWRTTTSCRSAVLSASSRTGPPASMHEPLSRSRTIPSRRSRTSADSTCARACRVRSGGRSSDAAVSPLDRSSYHGVGWRHRTRLE